MSLQRIMVEIYMILGLRMKIALCFILCFGFVLANDGVYASKNINYKEAITKDMIMQKKIEEKINCTPIEKNELEKNQYSAKRYIVKDTIICTKDVELFKKNAVVFDFGTFEIEQQGKIIFENEEYIRIKKNDGSIEKIFKDGRISK